MSSLTHSLVMRHNSWHARWYRYWLVLGGTPAAHKENFCRYVRVLLVWAPLRWFFKGRIGRHVPPWAVGLTTGVLAFIGVALYLWPTTTLKVLERLGIAVGVILGIALILVAVVYIYDRDPNKTKKVAMWTTSPIWIAPFLILAAALWVWDTFEDKFRAFGRFLEHRVFFGIHPIAVLFTLWIMAIVAIGFYKKPIVTAIFIGSLIGAVVIIIVSVIVVEKIKDWKAKKRMAQTWAGAKSKSKLARAYEGTADTVKLGATYIDSKKKGSRICPFIEFDNTDVA